MLQTKSFKRSVIGFSGDFLAGHCVNDNQLFNKPPARRHTWIIIGKVICVNLRHGSTIHEFICLLCSMHDFNLSVWSCIWWLWKLFFFSSFDLNGLHEKTLLNAAIHTQTHSGKHWPHTRGVRQWPSSVGNVNLRGGAVKVQIERGSSPVWGAGDTDIQGLCHTQLSGNCIWPQGPNLLLPSSRPLTTDHGEWWMEGSRSRPGAQSFRCVPSDMDAQRRCHAGRFMTEWFVIKSPHQFEPTPPIHIPRSLSFSKIFNILIISVQFFTCLKLFLILSYQTIATYYVLILSCQDSSVKWCFLCVSVKNDIFNRNFSLFVGIKMFSIAVSKSDYQLWMF